MKDQLSAIIDELFKDVPYSKRSVEAKKKVGAAFDSEYKSLTEGGCNELQAVGTILRDRGSIDDALKLTDIDDLDSLKSSKNSVTKRKFVLDFALLRLLTIVSALIFSSSLTYIFHMIIFMEPRYLVLVAISLLLGWLVILPCKRISKRYKFESILLTQTAGEQLFIYSDRFKKRLINSFILLIILTVNFISITFERALLSDMNTEEIHALIISNTPYMQIGLIICIKNILNTAFICRASDEDERKKSRDYLIKTGAICGGFLIGSIIITIILKRLIYNPYIVLYVLTIIFVAAFLLINLKKRASIVIKNIRINKPRIAVFTAAAIALGLVTYMKADTYLLQPYIMTVREVEHTDHEISYDKETGVYTITATEDDFRILHLTDIHIGGSAFSFYKDFKALEACRMLIEHTQPDFIIVTGDSVFPMGIMSLSLNNQAPVMQLANFLRNTGIPWAFTYGNHDTESMATGSRDDICKLYESLSFVNGGNLLYPDRQPEITGRSNQLIKIANPDGTLREVIFLIDSNDYTGNGINDYDYIHDDQVEWYAENLRQIEEDEGRVVPSMLFFHIPLREYGEAYDLYQQGSPEVKYYFGEIGETMINPICFSDYPSKLFDTAVELGSTQAMFCGHDHYNNISLEYKGIRLGYGMSIDYLAMPGISKDTKQRGAEVITITADADFDVEQIPLTSIETNKIPFIK